jgi:sugar transferase EpsL
VKRLFDILFVLAMAWLWVPMLVVTALAVLLIDGRPVFFLHERAGRGGKPFKVYKFRTMAQAEDGELVVTGLGRWLRRLSLDEVPQLVNVLVGDMSLVGPRPLPMAYLPRYSAEQARRLELRPGITGWAQVHGRNALTWEDKFRYDVEYVDRHSLWMDAKILLMTVPAAFAGGDDATEFMGTKGAA